MVILKANEILGWKPNYDLQALVKEMIREDLKIAKRLINDKKSKIFVAGHNGMEDSLYVENLKI